MTRQLAHAALVAVCAAVITAAYLVALAEWAIP